MYSWVSKITNQKWILTDTHKTTKCLHSIFFIIRTSKLIISSKLKGFRPEYSSKTILVILKLKKSS